MVKHPVQRTTTTGPTGEQASPQTPPAAPIAAEINWRVAPPAEVVVTRANLLDDATLEEIVSGRDQPATAEGARVMKGAEALNADQPTQIVLEGDPIPLRHRLTVRRYFQSIRPQDD